MSFFKKMSASIKTTAAFTAEATKKAAKATADFTKEQYNIAIARPKIVQCEQEGCDGKVDVSVDLWKWTCEAAECKTLNDDVKVCMKCQAVRPKSTNPTINCPVCEQKITVYPTVAQQQTAEAARYTKKGVKDVAAWSQNKFIELKSRPTTVQCKVETCKLLLAVPPEVWEWQCEVCRQPNEADAKVCSSETCQNKRPSFTPVLTCQCGAQVMVPSTAAKAQLDQGVAYTKEQTKQTATAAKVSYQHWTSAPQEFNCQHCNVKIGVPPPVFWNCVNCGNQNAPDIIKCTGCASKHKQEVMCGNCNQVCSVPDSNLSNAARSTKLSAKKGMKDLQASAQKLTTKSEEKKDDEAAKTEMVAN